MEENNLENSSKIRDTLLRLGAIKNEHLDYLEANLKELGLIFLLFNYPIGIIRYIIIIKKVVQNLITGVSNYL